MTLTYDKLKAATDVTFEERISEKLGPAADWRTGFTEVVSETDMGAIIRVKSRTIFKIQDGAAFGFNTAFIRVFVYPTAPPNFAEIAPILANNCESC